MAVKRNLSLFMRIRPYLSTPAPGKKSAPQSILFLKPDKNGYSIYCQLPLRFRESKHLTNS